MTNRNDLKPDMEKEKLYQEERNDIKWNDDESSLDQLFDTDPMSITKVVRRAKRRSVLRTICISVFGTLIVMGSVLWIGQSVTNRQQAAIEQTITASYSLLAPDTFIGETKRFKNVFSGSDLYSTYKLIEGHVVYTGDQNITYGLFSDHLQGMESQSILSESYTVSDANSPRYNLYGQREMIFYYPFLQYPTYRDDLPLLHRMGTETDAEVALSFDKGYTLSDVKQMLSGVHITWYWVNDLDQNEMQSLQEQAENNQDAGSKDAANEQLPVRSERSAVGIKTIDANGDNLENPVAPFVGALKDGLQNAKRLSTNNSSTAGLRDKLLRISRTLPFDSEQQASAKIKVYGAVITGPTDTLDRTLSKLDHVKAISLGAVANN